MNKKNKFGNLRVYKKDLKKLQKMKLVYGEPIYLVFNRLIKELAKSDKE